MLRNATWALSNFCRGKPAPAFELVSPALGTLARLIISSTDEDVLADACWALSYLSDGEDNDKIQEVIQAGVSRRLVELLMHGSYNVKTPALRTVGNILAGDDIQTQIVLNVGALPCLLSLLSSPKKPIQKEVCWALSNITAGNKRQIQAVIDANFFPPLIHLLATGEFNIKKEIVWVLSNAAVGGTFLNAKYLVDLGCIKPLCDLLLASDVRLIRTVLETLENILSLGENEAMQLCANPFVEAVEEADALDKLEQLQMHDNIEIYQLAVNLLEKYFGGEEDQNVAFTPAIDPASQNFMFGTSQSQSQSSAGGFDLHMDS
eukprot:TRINITY_DN4193_c0_g1_i1.p1 TRINITY_DN4193_c0_g1~~TRINITY_DN4193_c0_g1_i1.p1  ORF type:complete len:320 (-),score=62.98 TRINITY_DN4193_c0_g1_i1:159-1118(-)